LRFVDVETVGNWAGLSLWTRADLRRYAFLRVDRVAAEPN
jgi:hypothetical protein